MNFPQREKYENFPEKCSENVHLNEIAIKIENSVVE